MGKARNLKIRQTTKLGECAFDDSAESISFDH